jgi:fibronectin type 3 domain-containing protein
MFFGSSRLPGYKWLKLALAVVIVLVLCVQMLLILPSGVKAAPTEGPASSGNWTVQTVDGSGIGGIFSSIAVGSDGKQYISYYDATNGHLKYATNAGGSWATATVASTGAVGFYTSIAVDSNNKVHISYFDITHNDLKYSTNAGGSWATTTVDSTSGAGYDSCIALDSNGNAYIGYYNGFTGALKYATNAGGSWTSSTVASGGSIGHTSMALDANNKAYFSYWDNGDLKYATNADGSWATTTVDTPGDVGSYSSIAIDSNSKAYVSYYDATNSDLKYATNANGSWTTTTVDSVGNVGLYTSIALDSNDKACISYFDATNNNLKYATNAGGSWTCSTVDTGNVGQYTSIALDSNNTAYISYYDVTNNNLKYATNAVLITNPGVPGSVAAAGMIGHIHLSWQTPADGNSPLLGYRVYRSNSSGSETLLRELGAVTSYNDSDVFNGTTYFYKVTAFNAGYESDRSIEVSGKPYNVPSVPTNVIAVGGVRNVTVSWSPPANDNGAAVTGYLVSIGVQNSGHTVVYDAGLADRYVIGDLVNSTAYTVAVEAVNAAGNGLASSSNASTVGPTSMLNTSIISGDAWANVSWNVPSSDSPLLGYRLYRGTVADVLVQYQTLGPVAFYNDTSVTNGQVYYYRVVAFSQVGDGTAGNVVNATPSRSPGSPTGLSAATGDSQVSLSWTAPADNGGAPITGYAIRIGTAAGGESYLASVTGTTFTVTGLTNGQTYYFTVAAVNIRGNGTTTSEVSAMPSAVLLATTNFRAVAGIGNVTLSWSAPADNGGLAVSSYKIFRGPSLTSMVQIATVSTPGYLDVTAESGKTYCYQVVAVNAKGDGTASSLKVTSLNQPAQPSSVTVTRQGSGALVAWSENLGDPNASSVSGYAIYRDSGSGWELVGTINGTAISNYTDTNIPSGAIQYRVVPMGPNGVADLNSAGGSPTGALAAVDKGMDLMLPALAALGIVVALILVLFQAGKGRGKKDGQ